jgi:hydrogenase maturation protease
MAGQRRIVIGIGNPNRGDDAAGPAVVRRLRGALPGDTELVEHSGEATALLGLLAGATAAFLVDACASGAPAGTIHRRDLHEGDLPPAAAMLSSHGLGLAAALALARALNQLPPRCIVYAIEGQSFDWGTSLSPPVANAVDAVASRLRAELSETGGVPCTRPC